MIKSYRYVHPKFSVMISMYLLSLIPFSVRLQAVHVMDVAAAIVAAVKDDGTSMGKTYDLGGPDIVSVKDLVCYLLPHFDSAYLLLERAIGNVYLID